MENSKSCDYNTISDQIPNNFEFYTKTLRLGLWRILRQIVNRESYLNMEESLVKSCDCINVMQEEESTEINVNHCCSHGLYEINKKKMNNDDDNQLSKNIDKCHWKKKSKCHKRISLTLPKSLLHLFLLILITHLILLNSAMVDACGPGRGVGRRRAPRKLTPLVYKQHVPNIPEHNTPASGGAEGPITSGDHKRFKELVANYNSDIIFRDDEGTGADRLMNLRCKEKLNTLAISVMNQWPGVKLRVIEGWDDSNSHTPNSLHYEGRAVDITTSDKDRSKYGMLARLAVEAGFDWVYYESRAHIHCSVKSDSSQGGRSGGCFSGNSTVTTRHRGIQPVSSVVPGDELLTLDTNGKLTFSPLLLFLDRNTTEPREFLQITTSNGTQLVITPSHLLYAIPDKSPAYFYFDNSISLNSSSSSLPISSIHTNSVEEEITGSYLLSLATVTFANKVEIGDWLLIVDKSSPGASFDSSSSSSSIVKLEQIVDIQLTMEEGVYAPLTETGTVIVNNVVSSCYAVVESQSLAHWAFLPIRLLHNFSNSLNVLWRRFSFIMTFTTFSAQNQMPNSSNNTSSDGERAFVNMVKTHVKSHEQELQRLNSDEQGIHWYGKVLYSFTSRLLPAHYLYGS